MPYTKPSRAAAPALSSTMTLPDPPPPRPSTAPSQSLFPPPQSSLLSLLPSAVSNRLPRLSSLRRSISLRHLPPPSELRRASISAPTTPPSEPSSSLPGSPSTYGRAVALRGEDGYGWDSSPSSDTETEPDLSSTYGLAMRPAAAASTTLQQQALGNPQTDVSSETQSGVGWEYVAPALQLLHLAGSQSSRLSLEPGDRRGARSGSATVIRHLYIDSVKYLLRGLPSDLDESEATSIRTSFAPSLSRFDSSPAGGPNQPPPSLPTRAAPGPQPSLLHRTLSSTIILLFSLTYTFFAFLLPHLRDLFATLYRYEKEHKVAERMITEGTKMWIGFGRGAAGLAWECGGGDVLEWVVEGLQGGVKEGVEEGWRTVASQAVGNM